jgi:hypothetical protein
MLIKENPYLGDDILQLLDKVRCMLRFHPPFVAIAFKSGRILQSLPVVGVRSFGETGPMAQFMTDGSSLLVILISHSIQILPVLRRKHRTFGNRSSEPGFLRFLNAPFYR